MDTSSAVEKSTYVLRTIAHGTGVITAHRIRKLRIASVRQERTQLRSILGTT
jgi:hypothetical protein